MSVTTTTAIGGWSVVEYTGVVTGEAVLGANVFRDLFAGLRDIVGGRSAGYERSLRETRQTALEEMVAEAEELGADAVIGGGRGLRNDADGAGWWHADGQRLGHSRQPVATGLAGRRERCTKEVGWPGCGRSPIPETGPRKAGRHRKEGRVWRRRPAGSDGRGRRDRLTR